MGKSFNGHTLLGLIVIVAVIAVIIYLKRRKKYGKSAASSKVYPAPSGPAPTSNIEGLVRNNVICGIFQVTGTDPQTKQRSTVRVFAALPATNAEIQAKSGLKFPFTITQEKPYPATQPQIEYGHALGILMPADATKTDATYFISRKKGEIEPDEHPADDDKIRALIERGVFVPPYAGKRWVSDLLSESLDQSTIEK